MIHRQLVMLHQRAKSTAKLLGLDPEEKNKNTRVLNKGAVLTQSRSPS